MELATAKAEAGSIFGFYQLLALKAEQHAMNEAMSMFLADIDDPELIGSGDRDAHVHRSSNVATGLMMGHCSSIALNVYRALIEETLRFRKQGQRRHAGLLYANRGVGWAFQENLDDAVVDFLRADHEDTNTSGTQPGTSFAVSTLVEEYVAKRARAFAWGAGARIAPQLLLEDVDHLCKNRLGDNAYSFYGGVLRLQKHWGIVQGGFPNFFSRLQLLNSLRDLAVLLEVELKRLAHAAPGVTLCPKDTLLPTIEKLYANSIWSAFDDKRRNEVKATKKSAISEDDQLDRASALPEETGTDQFLKNLLICYVIRNYTAHNMDAASTLAEERSYELLGRIAYVMTVAPNH